MTNPRLRFAGLALCFVALPGFAQCQAGIPSEGNPHCIPPEIYQGQRVAEPQAPKTKRRWAALAIGESATGSVIGQVVDVASERHALRAAAADCKRQGGAQCKSVAFSETCAAIAWATDRYAIESAANRDRAAASALAACEGIGGEDCRVFHSLCVGEDESDPLE